METGGYIQPDEETDTLSQGDLVSLPQSITIPLQIGYDKSLFQHFSNNHFEAENFVRKVTALSMDYFIQVQTKRDFPVITWKVDRNIARFVNISITSDELCLQVSQENRHRAICS